MGESEESKPEKKSKHASLAKRIHKVPNMLRDFKKNSFSMKKGKYG